MYQYGKEYYKFHCDKYGHPSKFGFKDVIHEWKADKWDPENLIALYKRAGAKYFAAMANHHDNLDLYDSKYQPWNSVAVGPKKDIVGGWTKAARATGLRLALTCHGDRAWSWYQDAQRSDPTGPFAGVPYDGLLSKEAGKGQWWEGLDPQDLHAQYHPLGHYNWPQSGNPPLDKSSIFEQHKYKSASQIVKMLIDIVSKNGNLMLNIPVRGDGIIDEDEVACVENIAKWIAPNGEGIFATRPWKVYGEGPSVSTEGPKGQFGGARDVRPYTAEDMRFTMKGDSLYTFIMAWPETGSVVIKSLAANSPQIDGRKVADVSLLGHDGKLEWSQDEQGLKVKLPAGPPSEHAIALKIKGVLPS